MNSYGKGSVKAPAAAWEAADYLETGQVPKPLGNKHRLNAPYQLFETHDRRYLAIGTPNDMLFSKLMQVLGLADYIADPRFAPPQSKPEAWRKPRLCDSRPCERPVVQWGQTPWRNRGQLAVSPPVTVPTKHGIPARRWRTGQAEAGEWASRDAGNFGMYRAVDAGGRLTRGRYPAMIFGKRSNQ